VPKVASKCVFYLSINIKSGTQLGKEIILPNCERNPNFLLLSLSGWWLWRFEAWRRSSSRQLRAWMQFRASMRWESKTIYCVEFTITVLRNLHLFNSVPFYLSFRVVTSSLSLNLEPASPPWLLSPFARLLIPPSKSEFLFSIFRFDLCFCDARWSRFKKSGLEEPPTLRMKKVIQTKSGKLHSTNVFGIGQMRTLQICLVLT